MKFGNDVKECQYGIEKKINPSLNVLTFKFIKILDILHISKKVRYKTNDIEKSCIKKSGKFN